MVQKEEARANRKTKPVNPCVSLGQGSSDHVRISPQGESVPAISSEPTNAGSASHRLTKTQIVQEVRPVESGVDG